jgi:hypothetical protein
MAVLLRRSFNESRNPKALTRFLFSFFLFLPFFAIYNCLFHTVFHFWPNASNAFSKHPSRKHGTLAAAMDPTCWATFSKMHETVW